MKRKYIVDIVFLTCVVVTGMKVGIMEFIWGWRRATVAGRIGQDSVDFLGFVTDLWFGAIIVSMRPS